MGGQPFVGMLLLVPYNFAPVDYAFCDGSLLPISNYEALFNLIGTTYGGDGISNFALPDLRSRVPIHQGQGNGLSPYVIGQVGGADQVTLTVNQYPSHTHALRASSQSANSAVPQNNVPGSNVAIYFDKGGPPPMDPQTISMAAGNGLPHDNHQPYLGLNWVIALNGIYPPHG